MSDDALKILLKKRKRLDIAIRALQEEAGDDDAPKVAKSGKVAKSADTGSGRAKRGEIPALILKYLAKKPMKVAGLVDKMGKPYQNIFQALQALARKGQVVKNDDKTWSLAESAEEDAEDEEEEDEDEEEAAPVKPAKKSVKKAKKAKEEEDEEEEEDDEAEDDDVSDEDVAEAVEE